MNRLFEETDPIEKMEIGFKLILEGLGMDLENQHLKETPQRAARAWYNELCVGLTAVAPEVKLFESQADEMIMLRNIPIRSLCAHHLLPFFGEAAIAYVPGNGHLLGLSKLSRLADYYARKPTVQEELTTEIADVIAGHVMAKDSEGKVKKQGADIGGVGVVIRARHMCMELRGVEHVGDLITSAVRGVFLTKPEARAEFLQLRTEMREAL